MSVLIDPYMFELTDEQEIRDNLPFFSDILLFSSGSNQGEKLKLALYKGVVERLQRREIQPFPIKASKVKDKELKKTVLQINHSFSYMLMEAIESVDIDGCDGDQEFAVDGENVEDNVYFELFSTLLIPCYSNESKVEDKILTGVKNVGKQIGDKCLLKCECEKQIYSKLCLFVGICDVISPKDRALYELKEKKKNGEILVVESVEATMSDHHNHVQADGKAFKDLDDLSFRNNCVLKFLQKVGLNKIIFERFTPEGVRTTGTFQIQKLEEKDTQDILIVKFSAETRMLFITSLYFPKGIGVLIKQYFQNEQLTYNNVNELIEKIC